MSTREFSPTSGVVLLLSVGYPGLVTQRPRGNTCDRVRSRTRPLCLECLGFSTYARPGRFIYNSDCQQFFWLSKTMDHIIPWSKRLSIDYRRSVPIVIFVYLSAFAKVFGNKA